MDKAMVEALARRAGLDRALAEFPDDVAAAAAQASNTSRDDGGLHNGHAVHFAGVWDF